MHHENWKAVVAEMERVCKKHGRVIFDVTMYGIQSVRLSLVKQMKGKSVNVNFIDRKDLRSFNVIHTAHFPLLFPITTIVVIEKI